MTPAQELTEPSTPTKLMELLEELEHFTVSEDELKKSAVALVHKAALLDTLGLPEGEEVTPEVLEAAAAELRRKGAVYDDMVTQEKLVGALNAEWADRKADATEAKKAYEAAVQELRRIVRVQAEKLPLFDQEKATPETWREVALEDLGISSSSLELLEEADITTIGELADYSKDGKALTDIDGIGPARATAIEGFLDDFWAAHPLLEDEGSGDPGELEGGAE